jgi:hypothetical protein
MGSHCLRYTLHVQSVASLPKTRAFTEFIPTREPSGLEQRKPELGDRNSALASRAFQYALLALRPAPLGVAHAMPSHCVSYAGRRASTCA